MKVLFFRYDMNGIMFGATAFTKPIRQGEEVPSMSFYDFFRALLISDIGGILSALILQMLGR